MIMRISSNKIPIDTPTLCGYTHTEQVTDQVMSMSKPRMAAIAGPLFESTSFFLALYLYTGKIQGEKKIGFVSIFDKSEKISAAAYTNNNAAEIHTDIETPVYVLYAPKKKETTVHAIIIKEVITRLITDQSFGIK